MSPDFIQPPLPMPEHELTGLPNRVALHAMVERRIWERPGSIALYEMDLDNFKGVNDLYGHPEGDAFLINVADILNALVRRVPSANGHHRAQDVIGYGLASHASGDEFWIMLDGVDQEAADEIIARIQSTLDDHGIGASIGGRLHRPGESADDLFEDADRLMYVNKQYRLDERYNDWQQEGVRLIGQISLEREIDPRDIPALLELQRKKDEETA